VRKQTNINCSLMTGLYHIVSVKYAAINTLIVHALLHYCICLCKREAGCLAIPRNSGSSRAPLHVHAQRCCFVTFTHSQICLPLLLPLGDSLHRAVTAGSADLNVNIHILESTADAAATPCCYFQRRLDDYDTIRVINFIRREVAAGRDPLPALVASGQQQQQQGSDPAAKPWAGDELLNPTLPDDPLITYDYEEQQPLEQQMGQLGISR
jgi:hypothetical protein